MDSEATREELLPNLGINRCIPNGIGVTDKVFYIPSAHNECTSLLVLTKKKDETTQSDLAPVLKTSDDEVQRTYNGTFIVCVLGWAGHNIHHSSYPV